MTNKICLIPDMSEPYNVKMMADLSSGLRQIGYDSYYHNAPIEDKALNNFVEKNNFNTVLRINKPPQRIQSVQIISGILLGSKMFFLRLKLMTLFSNLMI